MHLQNGGDTVLHNHGGHTFYNRDDSIALETVRLARQVAGIGRQDSRNGSRCSQFPRSDTGKGSELGRRRSTFLARVTGVLETIVPAVSVQPLSTLVIDYEPWVRWMVSADDRAEEAEVVRAATEKRVGRATRNSQRQSYVRYVTLTNDQRGLLKSSAFPV